MISAQPIANIRPTRLALRTLDAIRAPSRGEPRAGSPSICAIDAETL